MTRRLKQRVSSKLARDLVAQSAKSRKEARVKNYKETIVDGIKFHSKKEAKRYSELKMLEQSGDIRDLELQVRIGLEGRDGAILTPGGKQMTYVADFRYWDVRLNVWVIEDAKGWKTDTYNMKKAILAAQGVDIVET